MVDGYPAEKHLEAVACVAFSTLQQQQARLEAMRQGIAGMDGSKKSSRLANRLPSIARKPHAKKVRSEWAQNRCEVGKGYIGFYVDPVLSGLFLSRRFNSVA